MNYNKSLKSRIDYYMNLKGIKTYSDLLASIGKQLGYQTDNDVFVKNEKSNFSKMVNGRRPLKRAYIIPLENIFGISFSRLVNEDPYLTIPEKQDIPYDKGFRYYAFKDDYDLYVNEFDVKVDKNGGPIMCNIDEFQKGFIDYAIEYSAKNAVRYLYDVYKINTCGYFDGVLFIVNRGKKHAMPISKDKTIAFARLTASLMDAELFYNIFDSYKMFFSNGHYGGDTSLFNNDEYIKVLLENEHLFIRLFNVMHYEYEYSHPRITNGIKHIVSADIPNPILNNCLNYSLKHLDKYKRQAESILEFGIKYNTELQKQYPINKYRCVDELGGIRDGYSSDFLTMAIVVDESIKVRDNEIQNLIARLPKYGKGY